jgi:hypothetical protein
MNDDRDDSSVHGTKSLVVGQDCYNYDMDSKILTSVNMLLSKDGYLLFNDLHERSITHKLGEYIQREFPNWNVDCEYNKYGTDPKLLGMNVRSLLVEMKKIVKKALDSNKISNYESNKIMDEIDNHERLIDIYGEKVSSNIARSFYKQISEMNIDAAEINGMLRITITKSNSAKIGVESVSICPDIIIHHRGTNNNMAVIEVKKSSEHKNERWLWDYVKLLAMMHLKGLYSYKYGYFINLPVGKDLRNHTDFESSESLAGFVVVKSI